MEEMLLFEDVLEASDPCIKKDTEERERKCQREEEDREKKIDSSALQDS